MAQATPQYAGFWIRVVAYLIDIVVMSVWCSTIIGIIVASRSYMPIMWWKKGATLGTDGARPQGGPGRGRRTDQWPGGRHSLHRPHRRHGPLYIGVIWVAFEPRKRGWHDMMAGTVVVK